MLEKPVQWVIRGDEEREGGREREKLSKGKICNILMNMNTFGFGRSLS